MSQTITIDLDTLVFVGLNHEHPPGAVFLDEDNDRIILRSSEKVNPEIEKACQAIAALEQGRNK